MSTRDELHRLIDRLSEEVFPDAARQLTEPHQRNRADATEAETEAAGTEFRRSMSGGRRRTVMGAGTVWCPLLG
jgi:hypothetical protein